MTVQLRVFTRCYRKQRDMEYNKFRHKTREKNLKRKRREKLKDVKNNKKLLPHILFNEKRIIIKSNISPITLNIYLYLLNYLWSMKNNKITKILQNVYNYICKREKCPFI